MKRHDEHVVSAERRVQAAHSPNSESSGSFLHRVRRALFEPEPTSAPAEPPMVTVTATASSELEDSIASTLRDAVSRDSGPALAEFNLRIDAVRSVVSDPGTQIRIALSVLSKKSISRRDLEQDLAAVMALLAQQLSAFSDKLAARRREHALDVEQAESRCRDARAAAEAEISALEAALASQRQVLARASAERESRLAELSTTEVDFEQKERAFRSAQASVLAEYERLARDLEKSFGEKV